MYVKKKEKKKKKKKEKFCINIQGTLPSTEKRRQSQAMYSADFV